MHFLKRGCLSVPVVLALALASARADNPHGCPPGQAKKPDGKCGGGPSVPNPAQQGLGGPLSEGLTRSQEIAAGVAARNGGDPGAAAALIERWDIDSPLAAAILGWVVGEFTDGDRPRAPVAPPFPTHSEDRGGPGSSAPAPDSTQQVHGRDIVGDSPPNPELKKVGDQPVGGVDPGRFFDPQTGELNEAGIAMQRELRARQQELHQRSLGPGAAADSRYGLTIPAIPPPREADPRFARRGERVERSADNAPDRRPERVQQAERPLMSRLDERELGRRPEITIEGRAPGGVIDALRGPSAADPPALRRGRGVGGEDARLEAAGLLEQAKQKMDAGNFAGAVMDLDRTLATWPENPQAYNLKATALNRLGQYEDALTAALRSIALQKEDNPAAYEAAAWAYLHMGRYEDAVRMAGEAIRRNPDSALAFAIRAFAYEQLGRRDRMLGDLRMAAKLDPRTFGRYLRAAEKGQRVFSPGTRDGRQLLEALASGRLPRGWPWWSMLVALGALGGAAALGFKRVAGMLAPVGERERRRRMAVAVLEPQAGADDGLLAGKYQMSRVIGKGGMGQVWEALDRTLDRPVAIKKVSPELVSAGQESRENCLREARTLASVHHPNIVDIYEVLDLPNGVYLVFELLSGKTVHQMLVEGKRLPLPQVKRTLAGVCSALEYAHGRGIVHRDLKPANIMVGDQGHVKVMDFGIARRSHERTAAAVPSAAPSPLRVDHTRTVAGTPSYMAPESERGLVSPLSDVYALGACFYEMLVGEPPFVLAPALRAGRPPAPPSSRVPGLPGEADELALRALEYDMDKRIRSAREFAKLLEAVPEPTRV